MPVMANVYLSRTLRRGSFGGMTPAGDRQPAFRPPSEDEESVIAALLSPDFPARAALQAQWARAVVRPIDADGSLEVRVDGGPLADVEVRVPVEAELEDSDGVTVHVLLHVIDGYMREIEVYREDSEPVQAPLDPSRLRVTSLPFSRD
jgi:hypothetical protein